MAIRTASDKILVVVEHVTTEKTGDYGPYRSVLFRRYDLEGDDAKIWKSMKPEQAQLFKKGMQAYLIPAKRDGKDTYDIELIDGAATPSSTRPCSESPGKYNALQLSADQKRAIADYTEEQLSLLRFLWDSVQKKFEDQELSEESTRCIATSLYIQIQKKFP